MATPDSGDSNLSKEPGNEECDIIICVAIGASGNALLMKEKFPSTRFKETEVAQSFERNCKVCLLVKPIFLVDFLDRLSPFIVIHVYSRCVIW